MSTTPAVTQGSANGYPHNPKDDADSYVASITQSPQSHPSSSGTLPEKSHSQPQITSALRQEQKPNGPLTGSSPNGGILRSTRSEPGVLLSTPVVSSQQSKEFPFSAPPGASGQQPTNDLMTRAGEISSSNGVEAGEAVDVATDLAKPAVGNLSRKGTMENGTTTPQGRRSVQFARSNATESVASHSRHQSGELPTEDDGHSRERDSSRLFSRLKALASPAALKSHGRSMSGWATGGDSQTDGQASSTPLSPLSDRPEPTLEEEAQDADAEESAGEGPSTAPVKKKRRFRMRTADSPSTPRPVPRRKLSLSDVTPPTSAPANRPAFMFRSATMNDIPEHQRMGVSEDEGRDRLAGSRLWRRGSAWVGGRGTAYNVTEGTPEPKRPRGLRRLTGFAGHESDASPSAWRRGERTSSASAQRWRQLKASLKMLSSRRKEERIIHAKSAELMAELLAGAPAAVILASMFQRDEAGHRRIPVLLEQLQLKVTDSHKVEFKGDKHLVFRIELEYGSALARVKWVVNRTLGDIVKMHSRYKLQGATDKYIQFRRDHERSKQPKFPKSTFPAAEGFLRDIEVEEDDEPTAGEHSGQEGEAERPGPVKRRRSSFTFMRKRSTLTPVGGPESHARQGSFSGVVNAAIRAEYFAERQRRKLEEYLNKMVTWVMFRPESNRLCRFLELSALGVVLAPEGGYHGKEGFMAIHSMTGLDVRKGIKPSPFRRRLPSKWFLVRHNYLVAVDSPEQMNVYDVFLVDPDFSVTQKSQKRKRDETAQDLVKRAKESAAYHTKIKISNSERTMKLGAHDERRVAQFVDSINFMKANTVWAQRHRFDSFAPVRHNVHAQVLIDGRDYMWNVSRAISMARDVIYIHDWWLSPEIYLRRPAAISQKWRLDRLLKRKADEGVKIYVIMYRNVNSAIPIDSEYSKFSLLNLSEKGNIFVQRSPNQLRQSTFFWSHHEKILVVDHCVAFCGGVDLCFGRWDTPSHLLTDDKLTGFEINDVPKDADHCQLWPGKDYSNPRVQDFYSLDRPYEEMYDRTKVPRMPWHDVGMQIVGEPARDLSRHFIQRWNYVLRQRTPTRPTPMLLPPPDFLPADIEALRLQGTCEVQLLRSACEWSLGTTNKVEHSIMTAYVSSILESEHLVYIENQFFITSCEHHGVKMENAIGDALVERIIRAAEKDEDWRAIIVIPLMPGYQNAVDSGDGTSVRLIMLCQYASICRGETSIFARLRAHDIDPEDYIQFYSLRQWGKIGPTKALVTEQLYIHAKIMIVDDRIAIIGSANINERSMLGSRDSEVAAIIRDNEMLQSYMAGREYSVAKFAHNMRVRLMREHLGLDVDRIREEEEEQHRSVPDDDAESIISDVSDGRMEQTLIENKLRLQDDLIRRQDLHTFNHEVDWAQADNPNIKAHKKPTTDPRIMGNPDHEKDVLGEGIDHMLEHNRVLHDGDGRDSIINARGEETLSPTALSEHTMLSSKAPRKPQEQKSLDFTEPDPEPEYVPPPPLLRMDTRSLGLPQLSTLPALPATDDTDIGGPPLQHAPLFDAEQLVESLGPFIRDMRMPVVTDSCMIDPLSDHFFLDVWHTVAENNTKLYRQVFRCQPDNDVRTWPEYKEYEAFQERFNKSQGVDKSKRVAQQESTGISGPPGTNATANGVEKLGKGIVEKVGEVGDKLVDLLPLDSGNAEKSKDHSEQERRRSTHPLGTVEEWAQEQEEATAAHEAISPSPGDRTTVANDEKAGLSPEDSNSGATDPTVNPNNATRTRNITISESPKPLMTKIGENIDATIPGGDARVKNHPAQATANPTLPSRTASTAMPRDRSGTVATTTGSTRKKRRRAPTNRSIFHADDPNIMLSKEDAERVLMMVQGSLVVFPYYWLEEAEWGFTVDNMAPLEIYD